MLREFLGFRSNQESYHEIPDNGPPGWGQATNSSVWQALGQLPVKRSRAGWKERIQQGLRTVGAGGVPMHLERIRGLSE